MGGFTTSSSHSKWTVKRNISELMEIHTVAPIIKVAKSKPLLGFADSEKVYGIPNVITGIYYHNVARYLVDEGSFVDILYQAAFEKLGLWKENLESYDNTKLHGFNEISTRLWDMSSWA